MRDEASDLAVRETQVEEREQELDELEAQLEARERDLQSRDMTSGNKGGGNYSSDIDLSVSGQVDREALQSELRKALDGLAREGQPYELSDHYSVLSWGADAASIVMVVGTTLVGLHAAIAIIESLANRFGRSSEKPSRDAAPELARQ